MISDLKAFLMQILHEHFSGKLRARASVCGENRTDGGSGEAGQTRSPTPGFVRLVLQQPCGPSSQETLKDKKHLQQNSFPLFPFTFTSLKNKILEVVGFNEILKSKQKGKNHSSPAKEKPIKGNRLLAYLILFHFTSCFTDAAIFIN